MRKNLHLLKNSRGLTSIMMLVFFVCSCSNVFGQQTTLLSDNFDRADPSTGGPISYTKTTPSPNTATIIGLPTTAPDFRVQIKNSPTGTPATIGTSFLMGSMSTVSGYNTKLNSNTNLITWSFNMRHGKSVTPNNMTGWATGTAWGTATVIACSIADPTSASANGYAVVMGGTNTQTTYDLVSFTGGLNNNLNLTSMIVGNTPAGSWKNVISIKVTYNPSTNTWDMSQKDEGSSGALTAYPDPSGISVPSIGEVPDTAGFVNNALPNFGFVFNYRATANNSALYDNYKVTKGTVAVSNFYLASNSDCTNVLNWWSNANGTSGTHPADFTSDAQIFNIHNSGGFISTDWTVSGAISKVVLGKGSATTLTIPETAALIGKIDLAASSTLIISNLLTFPNLQTLNPSSTVTYNGSDGQKVQGATYGNLKIATLGTNGASASGAISINGNLDIATESILDMGSNKLATVSTLTGSGILITKNEFSSSLPSGLTWPYDVYFAYGSANNSQNIPFGFYKNLDLTGGPRRLSNDIFVSGTYNPGIDVLTVTNEINFNGTSPQIIPASFYNSLTVSNPTVATATGVLYVSGNITGTGALDASAATIVLNGATNQSINSGSFVGNKLGGLTVTNPTEIASTTDIDLTGILTLQAGIFNTSTNNFKLVSNAAGTASVASVDGVLNTGSIVGNVKVERYLSNQRGWNLIGNPIQAQVSLADLSSLSTTAFDVTYVNDPSSRTYSNDSWTGINSGATTLAFDSSIALFNRGVAGQGAKGDYTGGGPSNVTLAISGPLNLAPTSISTVANRYYLVANPFAAPISLAQVLSASTGLSGSVAYYDPNANSVNVQTNAGSYLLASPTGIPGDITDVVIPSMGAFFVRANTAGTITVPVAAIYTGSVSVNPSITQGTFAASPGIDPDSTFLSTKNFNLSEIKYYPNPVINTMTITNKKAISEVVIYNLMGQKVASFKPNANSTEIEMSKFNASTYLVQVTSDNVKSTYKVIKK